MLPSPSTIRWPFSNSRRLLPAQRSSLAIGGRGSRLDAGPLTLEVELLRLGDGKFELEDKQSHLAGMGGDRFDMGPCAVVRHEGLTILLTTHKTPPFDLGQWRSQGMEPTKFSIIVVKAAVAASPRLRSHRHAHAVGGHARPLLEQSAHPAVPKNPAAHFSARS